MNFSLLDALINLVMVAFWYQIWRKNDSSDSYNPYIYGISRPAQQGIQFLRHALPVLSPRLISLLLLAFCIGFRALASQRSEWDLVFGFEKVEPNASLMSNLRMSIVSFAMFLFNIWGLSLMYVRADRDVYSDHTKSALFLLSTPFVRLPAKWRPPALLLYGILIACLLINWSTHSGPPLAGRVVIAHAIISSLMAWFDLLLVLVNLMVILIIGSWITMIAGTNEMGYFCKSWIDLIVGPLRRFPMIVGPLDLTPIVFMFGVSFLYNFLRMLLHDQYRALSIF
jgi:uncharacterized protein YggT (Ycf19 family)